MMRMWSHRPVSQLVICAWRHQSKTGWTIIHRPFISLSRFRQGATVKTSRLTLCRRFADIPPKPNNNNYIHGKEYNLRLQGRAYASFFVALFFIWLIETIVYEDKKKKQIANRERNLVVHTDPHIKGKAGELALRNGCWLPKAIFPHEALLDQIWEFPIKPNDVIVASFPKSGTTWVQEIVYLLQTGVDTDTASRENIEERFPYLEYVYPGLKELAKRKSPRLLKSHLPYHHLPKDIFDGKGKVIYIARNPKDVAVSYYFFAKMFSESSYSGSINDFAKSFLAGQVAYGPWALHVKDFYDMKKMKKNILFITYEDLQENPKAVIVKIARFLGKSVTSEQASTIAKHCSFSNMKANPATNYSWWEEYGLKNKGTTDFMRKGVVGDWKNYLSEETSKEFDKQCESWLREGPTFRDSSRQSAS